MFNRILDIQLKITDKEIKGFWREWWAVQIVYFFCLILPGLFFAPLAFLLRYGFKWRKNPFDLWLNDETDFGEEKWLKDEGLKKGLWSAILWWKRNPAWNWMKSQKVPSHADPYDILTITDTLDFSDALLEDVNDAHALTHANRDKRIYGEKEVYYRLSDGKVYGRKSRATEKKERMRGVGNERYVWRRKPIL